MTILIGGTVVRHENSSQNLKSQVVVLLSYHFLLTLSFYLLL